MKHKRRVHFKHIEDKDISQAVSNIYQSKDLVGIVIEKIRRAIQKDVDNTSKPKSFVVDGVWQVPPEERPKGWEGMEVREKENGY